MSVDGTSRNFLITLFSSHHFGIYHHIDAYNAGDLYYEWKESNPVSTTSPQFLDKGLTLTSAVHGYCNVKTSTGAYSCLKLDIVLKPNKGEL